MSETKHIPVRPNINNGSQSANKSNGPPGLFLDMSDKDVQHVISKKKTNALELKSEPTMEEQGIKALEKREKSHSSEDSESTEADNSAPKSSKGSSWVIIALAVIVIALIIIIIYYVIQYNNLNSAPPIPENVVKPSSLQNMMASATAPAMLNPGINQNNGNNAHFAQKNSTQNNMLAKPKNYVEPSKSDLNSVLDRLSTITEESETSPEVKNNTCKQNSIPKITEYIEDDEVNTEDKMVETKAEIAKTDEMENDTKEEISLNNTLKEMIMQNDDVYEEFTDVKQKNEKVNDFDNLEDF